MSDRNQLILQVHLAGADPYQLGDEIWQQSLCDAIRVEAEIVADHAGSDLLPSRGPAARVALRDRVVAEMTAALQQIGDTYTAPDRIAYTLTDQGQLDLPARQDTLATMSRTPSAPIVEKVLRFKDLPVGSSATRAAIVRWSDGTEARPWPGTQTRSSSAKAIMGTFP